MENCKERNDFWYCGSTSLIAKKGRRDPNLKRKDRVFRTCAEICISRCRRRDGKFEQCPTFQANVFTKMKKREYSRLVSEVKKKVKNGILAKYTKLAEENKDKQNTVSLAPIWSDPKNNRPSTKKEEAILDWYWKTQRGRKRPLRSDETLETKRIKLITDGVQLTIVPSRKTQYEDCLVRKAIALEIKENNKK